MATDTTDNKNLSVTEARNNFSQLVNRTAFAGEVTFVHRGRNHEPVAAIAPADLVEQYEALWDQEEVGSLWSVWPILRRVEQQRGPGMRSSGNWVFDNLLTLSRFNSNERDI
ncbi:hypothetical protein [Acidithrix sp. C25]|uniref:hypothetical protein n=1 Tax=Acidithrix sp. C25 TaxID=1671482 RepID=UPI00191B93F5|nr:hypothetical protein [Acidithrix sp. C25]CAG4908973.1 unnamed protein product [Acidithrix sp. C25]